MITSFTILTTTLIIALALSIVSATLQVIEYDNNIKRETDAPEWIKTLENINRVLSGEVME